MYFPKIQPLMIEVFLGSILIGLAIIAFVIELILTLLASLNAKVGKDFQYPLTIHFIK